ncbi:MAG: hypothetical protein KJ592_04810 [Nanoarchaeota archaeon]|nr:hypothetical protein [Nanoarchaeota archaeon]
MEESSGGDCDLLEVVNNAMAYAVSLGKNSGSEYQNWIRAKKRMEEHLVFVGRLESIESEIPYDAYRGHPEGRVVATMVEGALVAGSGIGYRC